MLNSVEFLLRRFVFREEINASSTEKWTILVLSCKYIAEQSKILRARYFCMKPEVEVLICTTVKFCK